MPQFGGEGRDDPAGHAQLSSWSLSAPTSSARRHAALEPNSPIASSPAGVLSAPCQRARGAAMIAATMAQPSTAPQPEPLNAPPPQPPADAGAGAGPTPMWPQGPAPQPDTYAAFRGRFTLPTAGSVDLLFWGESWF